MNKATKTMMSVVLVSTGLLTAVSAAAAPGATPGSPANYPTKGQVIFEPNDGPTDPVYPEEPGTPGLPVDPIDPENPIEPGTDGPLSIDYASTYNFGTQKITSVDKVYYAATQEIISLEGVHSQNPNYAQITDNRGTLAGWELSVKQNGQFKTAAGKELNGSVIKFLAGEIDTVSEADVPSTVAEEVELSPTGAVSQLVKANKGEAAGTWIYRLGTEATMDEAVQLHVPGKSIKLEDTYTTTLTWILSTLPGN